MSHICPFSAHILRASLISNLSVLTSHSKPKDQVTTAAVNVSACIIPRIPGNPMVNYVPLLMPRGLQYKQDLETPQ